MTVKWVTIGITFGKLAQSVSLKDKKNIKILILDLIECLKKIAIHYNINLNESWFKWKKKAIAKRYYSGP